MPASNAPTPEVAVVVVREAEVETGVDVSALVARDAGHDKMVTVTSMLVTRPLSPRYRENVHLASCDTSSIKMIWLQHDTTTCISSLLLFVS